MHFFHSSAVLRNMIAVLGCLAASGVAAPAPASSQESAPRVQLKFVADLDPAGPGKENSGIVKSRQWDDVFWIHNDSGDEPRLYAVRASGKAYDQSRADDRPGVLIGGAINVDWEDITTDARGNILIADVGNNSNSRRDLVIYHIREPAPQANRTSVFAKTFFYYPEQRAYPAPKSDFNYDCEAIFTVGAEIFLFTKHRSDTRTRLYRIDTNAKQPVAAELLGGFDPKGQIVAADCTADGKRLVVASYSQLWLFERENHSQNFLSAKARTATYESEQVEAVCFRDSETLLLADEKLGKLFTVPLAEFAKTRIQGLKAVKP